MLEKVTDKPKIIKSVGNSYTGSKKIMFGFEVSYNGNGTRLEEILGR